MSITVAANAYHARIVFGDSGQRATNSNQDDAVAAAPDKGPTIAAASPASNLSGALNEAGLSKGGGSASGSQDGNQADGAAGKTTKLQEALTTLLGALGPSSSSTSRDGVQDAIQTILGALKPASGSVSAMGGAGVDQGAASTDAARNTSRSAPSVKPNLDALNRVLSHYTAQSAATSTVLSLVS